MRSLSDSELISRYINGNENALAALIGKHQKDLFSFIYYKVMDEELANDFFQDTFMKIILTFKEGRYQENGKFIIWAKKIAQNLIIDHFRIKTKYVKISETTYENEEFSIFDTVREPDGNIEELLINRQINEDLAKMLAHLPENQQEVIKMRFFDGLSFKEIADQTNISINTALGRMRYAVINLRKLMEEHKIILTP